MIYGASGGVLKPGAIKADRPPCSIPCNLCGAASVGVLSLNDPKGAYLRTVICKKCGLIWRDPRPGDGTVATACLGFDRKECEETTIPKRKQVYRAAKEALRRYLFFKDLIKKGDRLLDIGAGFGVFVYCLRRFGHDAQGIEPDERHCRYGREVLDAPIATGFVAGVKEQAAYDLVTLHHILMHLHDPLAALQHIWTTLKPGGRLVVEVPNAEDIRRDPKNRYHGARLYTFNPETLIALGQKAGFAETRKKIAPLNGDISVVFQKKDKASRSPVNLTGNHLKIIAILNRHTRAAYFTSSAPYAKFLNHFVTAFKETAAIGGLTNHKDIIGKVIADEKSGSDH